MNMGAQFSLDEPGTTEMPFGVPVTSYGRLYYGAALDEESEKAVQHAAEGAGLVGVSIRLVTDPERIARQEAVYANPEISLSGRVLDLGAVVLTSEGLMPAVDPNQNGSGNVQPVTESSLIVVTGWGVKPWDISAHYDESNGVN